MGVRLYLSGLILLGYAATLGVSSWHLAEWYALSKGSLPGWLSFALAVTLEFNAFLLSFLSNSFLRHSPWARGGAVAALGLVWMGNFLSMARAAPGLAVWEVMAASLFVPIGTYVMAKVMGELWREERPFREGAKALEAPFPLEAGYTRVLEVLGRGPARVRDMANALPEYREALPRILEDLERKGRIRFQNGYWTLSEGVEV